MLRFRYHPQFYQIFRTRHSRCSTIILGNDVVGRSKRSKRYDGSREGTFSPDFEQGVLYTLQRCFGKLAVRLDRGNTKNLTGANKIEID